MSAPQALWAFPRGNEQLYFSVNDCWYFNPVQAMVGQIDPPGNGSPFPCNLVISLVMDQVIQHMQLFI